ncbi:hypothetical protein BpHYR1_048189 [Brachionus plicatilis]|uniref:RNA-directed DNA polymerase from mobile element jockey-like n=1 Tax=Brachionus plicatilis TaxID=10195 RepID=A0A3M7RYZ1_BRAPC|nr:hypothetical protein BpHYR1_048189 [Brachionus plicatilis]
MLQHHRSDTWKTKFNKEKCLVMYFGANNSCYDLQIGGHMLAKTTKERDLGIIVTSDLKSSEQRQEPQW